MSRWQSHIVRTCWSLMSTYRTHFCLVDHNCQTVWCLRFIHFSVKVKQRNRSALVPSWRGCVVDVSPLLRPKSGVLCWFCSMCASNIPIKFVRARLLLAWDEGYKLPCDTQKNLLSFIYLLYATYCDIVSNSLLNLCDIHSVKRSQECDDMEKKTFMRKLSPGSIHVAVNLCLCERDIYPQKECTILSKCLINNQWILCVDPLW